MPGVYAPCAENKQTHRTIGLNIKYIYEKWSSNYENVIKHFIIAHYRHTKWLLYILSVSIKINRNQQKCAGEFEFLSFM
jgi:hypothetical protein